MIRRLYNKWLWKRFYRHVINVEKVMHESGNIHLCNKCIDLENLMNYLKSEIIYTSASTGGDSSNES